jgi:hypothetical protein
MWRCQMQFSTAKFEDDRRSKLKFRENLVDVYTKGKMIWNKKQRSQRLVLSVPVRPMDAVASTEDAQ